MPGVFTDPRFHFVCATRVLVERCAREMLLRLYPNVEWRSPVKVAALHWDAAASAVTGATLLQKSQHFDVLPCRGGGLAAFVVLLASGMQCHVLLVSEMRSYCLQVIPAFHDLDVNQRPTFSKALVFEGDGCSALSCAHPHSLPVFILPADCISLVASY